MLVRYVHPQKIPIVDGRVVIEIPEYELAVEAEVVQVKGRGTTDADRLTELNHYHRDIIGMLLQNPKRVWDKYRGIIQKMRIVKHLEDPSYAFIENNWQRPCSELLRKGILRHYDGKRTKYYTDFEVAKRALETGRFEKK